MILEYKDRHIAICDACGAEMEHVSEFVIRMDYGSEDDCFGNGGKYETALRGKYDEQQDYDRWDAMRSYLSQQDYHSCDDCRHGDSKHYMRKFEDAARERRSQILLQLEKTGKIPELCDEEKLYEKHLKEHQAKLDSLEKEIAEDAKKGYGFRYKLDDYARTVHQIHLIHEGSEEE